MSVRNTKAEIERKKEQLRVLREGKNNREKTRSQKATKSRTVDEILGEFNLGPLPADSGAARPASISRSWKRPALSISEIRQDQVAPMKSETYEKVCQTDALPELEAKKEEEEQDKSGDGEDEEASKNDTEERKEEEKKEEVVEEPKIPTLAPEAVKDIIGTSDFQDFFDKSTKTLERLLHYKKSQWSHKVEQHYDPLEDYTTDYGREDDTDKGEAVTLTEEMYLESLTGNRAVTALDWCSQKPELMCASYNANPDTPHAPDGIVCLWNRHSHATPQDVFECQSSVLSCSFTPFSPHVIVGGTYSGQVVLWDSRESKRTPVQRSAISSDSHTHPVFCLSIVGSKTANSLVTVSTDGKMCSWDMDTLNAPQDTMELNSGQGKFVAGTCFSFPQGGINEFVLGSEEGCVYKSCRTGARAGIGHQFEEAGAEGPVAAHYGPATAADFHKTQGGGDFGHLFLTSSTDWTTKLWSYRNEKQPLLTFENASDYVYDVKWSPAHPGLFATADGTGALDVWNLNTSIEQPACSITVSEGKQALNRLKWTETGKHIAAGDAEGKVYLFEVADRLALAGVDEQQKFKNTIKDIELSSQEAIEPST